MNDDETETAEFETLEEASTETEYGQEVAIENMIDGRTEIENEEEVVDKKMNNDEAETESEYEETIADTNDIVVERMSGFRIPYKYPLTIKRELRSDQPFITKVFRIGNSADENNDEFIELTGRHSYGTFQEQGHWVGERSLSSGEIVYYDFNFTDTAYRTLKMTITNSDIMLKVYFKVNRDFIFLHGPLDMYSKNWVHSKTLLDVPEHWDRKYVVYTAFRKLSVAQRSDIIEAAVLDLNRPLKNA